MSINKSSSLVSKESSQRLPVHVEAALRLKEEIGGILNPFKIRHNVHNVGGHTDWVNDIAYTPDETQLLSGSDDCTARLWDDKTGRCLIVYEGHTDVVRAVAVHPHGHLVATGSWDKTARIFEKDTGKCVGALKGHEDRIRSICFSPEGKHIYTASEDKTAGKWEVGSGKLLLSLKGHEEALWVVIVSTDGKYIFTGGQDRDIKKWDAEKGECLATLKGHEGDVSALCISKDGSVLYSAGKDKIIRRWDLGTDKCTETLTGHNFWIMSLSLSPDERELLSADWHGIDRVWSAKTGKCIFTHGGPTNVVNHTRFVAGEKRCVFRAGKRAGIIDLSNGNCVQEFCGHGEENVKGLCFDKRETLLAEGGFDGVTNVWDMKTGKLLHRLVYDSKVDKEINCVCISDDNCFLVTGSDSGYVTVWDIEQEKLVLRFQAHSFAVYAIVITQDRSRMITVGRELEDNIKIWDFETGEFILAFRGHKGSVFSIDLSDDGTLLASAGQDTTAKVWDVATGFCKKNFYGLTDSGSSIRLSHDKKSLVTGDSNGRVILWDIATGDKKTYEGCKRAVLSVDLSRDKTRIVAGGWDYCIRVWNAETGALIREIWGNDFQLRKAVFSSQGGSIVAGGQTSLKKWHPNEGRLLKEYCDFVNQVTALRWHKGLSELIIADWHGRIGYLNLQSGELMRVWEDPTGSAPFTLSPSGEFLVLYKDSDVAVLKDAQTGSFKRSFWHDAPVQAVLLSTKADLLFTGCDDGIARKWETHTGACVAEYRGHRGPIRDITINREETKLYTAGEDKTIRKWQVQSGRCERTYEGHSDSVTSIALNWTETRIFSGSADGTVKTWDEESGTCLRTMNAGSPIAKVIVTLDGGTVIAGCANGKVVVFNSITGDITRELNGHTTAGERCAISGLDFYLNEEILISASRDGTLKCWDMETGELRVTYYNLIEGFLWTTPPDILAPHGWFWTNRPELINVVECNEDGTNPHVLENEHERKDYIRMFNSQEMVMNRLNNYQKYCESIQPKPGLPEGSFPVRHCLPERF